MKVRELIEMLAKQDWNSKILIDSRLAPPISAMCRTKGMKGIKSISSFTSKGAPVVTLNVRK